jgi:hypothetical protein
MFSSSWIFVNGLGLARSAAFSGRSSGFFLRPEKSERRKSPRSRDLEVPAISGSPEIQVRDFWVMPELSKKRIDIRQAATRW